MSVAAVAALAAAAGLALYARQGPARGGEGMSPGEAWRARVAHVSVAGRDAAGGLSLCEANGASCVGADRGAEVTGGKLLRTDGRTRVHLELSDGTLIALDRATELALGEQAGRVANLRTGAIVADVAHLEQSN
ncbi:MAG: hypothetical protein MUF54_18995 [Polyangiaceae bacterium]|nr:hypothetical protein [Polyangiaceae bacterium]